MKLLLAMHLMLNYSKPQLIMITRGLLRVKSEDSEVIRKFIIEKIGNEALEIFDSLYQGNKKNEKGIISHGTR